MNEDQTSKEPGYENPIDALAREYHLAKWQVEALHKAWDMGFDAATDDLK